MSRRRRRTAQKNTNRNTPNRWHIALALAAITAAVLIVLYGPAGIDPTPIGVAAFEFARAMLLAKHR